jgi:hypothetical protein
MSSITTEEASLFKEEHNKRLKKSENIFNKILDLILRQDNKDDFQNSNYAVISAQYFSPSTLEKTLDLLKLEEKDFKLLALKASEHLRLDNLKVVKEITLDNVDILSTSFFKKNINFQDFKKKIDEGKIDVPMNPLVLFCANGNMETREEIINYYKNNTKGIENGSFYREFCNFYLKFYNNSSLLGYTYLEKLYINK